MLEVSSGLGDRLAAAGSLGLDLACVVWVDWPAPIGRRYYANRAFTLGGHVYEPKVRSWASVAKRADLSGSRWEALNDDVTIMLLNTPERTDGSADPARLQDILVGVPLTNVLVRIGFLDVRLVGSGSEADIKWDGLFRLERPRWSTHQCELYCVDATLQPGEKPVGLPILDADWPRAPHDSYGAVRGPVFGRVDSLALVPVDVGPVVNLASEVDDQDGVFEIEGDLRLWPDSGYLEIGDEVVYYPVIDRVGKRLGSVSAGCRRGTGFPTTAAAGHASGSVVLELYTGRETTLSGALSAGATSIVTTGGSQPLPGSGTVLIDSEVISYGGRTGNTLTGCVRGRAMPTAARDHDEGAALRLIPVGPDGQPRYRYVVAAGPIAGMSNVRSVDDNEVEAPLGEAPTLSLLTTATGKSFTVADFARRPRADRFATGLSGVPSEWILETDGTYDPTTGFALATSFLRWKAGPGMGSNLVAQLPLALDPAASAQAAVMKTSAADRVFDAIFNAHWDGGLMNPRRLFGKFRGGRLRVTGQYDRNSTTAVNYEVRKGGALLKSGVIRPPTAIAAGGSISGSQTLPRSRWGIQRQTLTSFLVNKTEPYYWSGPEGGIAWGTCVTPGRTGDSSPVATGLDGNVDTGFSGAWDYLNNAPAEVLTSPGQPFSGRTPVFVNSRPLPAATSKDKINSVTWSMTAYKNYRTPNTVQIEFFSDVGMATRVYNQLFSNVTSGVCTIAGGWSWSKIQAIKITLSPAVYLRTDPSPSGPNAVWGGNSFSNFVLNIEYDPQAEGQDTDTTVSGGYFAVSGVNVPSKVFEQEISLGRIAQDWARTAGVDPWAFFTKAAPAGTTGGVQVLLSLPANGDPVQFAVIGLALELDYGAAETVWDGAIVADVDGRTGTPVGGGAVTVLENPVDLLAYLIDSPEYFGMAAYRDSASFEAVREEAEGAGWRMALGVIEDITLRDLTAALLGESRLVLLFDQGTLFCRWGSAWIDASDAVAGIGDGGGSERLLLRDDFAREVRLEEFFNQVMFYYRRNLRTGDYRATMEARDEDSQAAGYGMRARPSGNLMWHQSARGYAGGFEDQKARVSGLAQYYLSLALQLWEYADVAVAPSVGETLQRCDTVLVNRARAGCYGAPGRVVALARVDQPAPHWSVTVQMVPQADRFYWQGVTAGGAIAVPGTFVRPIQGGQAFEFVISGVRVAVLTGTGDLRLKGSLKLLRSSLLGYEKLGGVPENECLRWTPEDDGGRLLFFLRRWDLAGPGEPRERVAWLTIGGDLVVGAVHDGGVNPHPVRDLVTVADLGAEVLPNGITDTGEVGVTGAVRFAVGGRAVMEIGVWSARLRGGIISGGLN